MLTLNDFIISNDSDLEVIVQGRNPADDCDPLVFEYFRGLIRDIPEDLRTCEFLYRCWSVGYDLPVLCIPFHYGESTLF